MWFLLLLGMGAAFVAGVAAASASEQRRRLEPPSEPRVIKPVTPTGPTPDERKAAALKARLQSLRAQYGPFSHYNDPAWLTKYAKEHQAWLLENRDDILIDSKKLHEQRLDQAYDVDLSYVYEQDRELYDRIMWQAKVLSIAERLEFEQKQDTDTQEAVVQKRAELARTIGDLFLEYRYAVHYEQDEWIEKYASNQEHQKQLLAQREEIVALDREFHRDAEFIEQLKACAPGIYRRATWKMQALTVADKLSVEPRRLTPEEREAKIIRFRERMLNRLQVKAEDQIALKLHRYLMAQQLKERGAALGLDDDELDRLEQELRGDLDYDDEDTGKGFKQL